MVNDGVTLSGDEIMRALSRADSHSREAGVSLEVTHHEWAERIRVLREKPCPRTYLPVLCVLLVARSLRSSEELDVLAIQRQAGPRGYAAASIGSQLIPFAAEHGIDLRARSSQVMNNQPFTFKRWIVADMTTKPYFDRFFEFATAVQPLGSEEAAEILALAFHLSALETEPIIPVVIEGDLGRFSEIIELTASFVRSHSENGKVGQAFVAATLDVAHGEPKVVMGAVSDPDASIPGDVHVVDESGVWLFCEVKQKAVTTGDVKTFLEKVDLRQGERILYAALANERYPRNIDEGQVARAPQSKRIETTVVNSPGDLLHVVLSRAPGSFASLASRLTTAFVRRMTEAGVSAQAIESYRESLN